MNVLKGSFIKNLIIALICLLLAYGEIVGIYHSLNEHPKEDCKKSIYIPPIAWYRSLEIWRHNKAESYNWNERLKTSTRNCLIIFTQYGKADAKEINKAIEDVKLELKKYPLDKYEYVKNFCKEYISYYRIAQKEFNQWVIKFFNNSDVRYQKGNELNAMESVLSRYEIDELNSSIKHNDSLFVLLYGEYYRMKQQYCKATPEGQKRFLEVIFRKDNINLQNIKAAYKNIFNEGIKM
jgi:hypothetical protein